MATKSVSKQQAKGLGEILEELLLTRTLTDVGLQLGVSPQWVHLHRNGGRNSIQKKVMPRVARGLGMSTEDLARLCRRNTNKVL
jgi:hypothetical protein